MNYVRADVYDLLDTMTLHQKEELLEYLKTEIQKEKNAPRKSYLEERWAEIKRLINVLRYEPYIDDQIEISMVWDICEELIASGKLSEEPWKLRRKIIKSILDATYYERYCVDDPIRDLLDAMLVTEGEKLECAEMMWQNQYDYVKIDGAKLYKKCGMPERYYEYLEKHLSRDEKPYLELIEYYKDLNRDKAVEIAELGLKKINWNLTEVMIFLVRDAKERGDEERLLRLIKGARLRRSVDYQRVREMCEIPEDFERKKRAQKNGSKGT